MVRKVVITLLLVLAAGLLWYSGIRKGEPVEPSLTDSAIERLVPPRDAPGALRQSEIGADLAPGWTGVLVINGIEIPEDQLRIDSALYGVYFTPGPGQEIESLPPGEAQATVIIWRPTSGETRETGSRSVTWRFRVG